MSTNERLDRAEQVSLPVPVGTKSGDPVQVGELVGVAETDRGYEPDRPENSTVKMVGSYDLEVEAADGAEEVALEIGDPVFIDGEGNLSADDSGKLFGYVLAPMAKGAVEAVEVKIATP